MHRRFDELGKQRVRGEGFGFQFRMILNANEPGVAGEFDDFRQFAIG